MLLVLGVFACAQRAVKRLEPHLNDTLRVLSLFVNPVTTCRYIETMEAGVHLSDRDCTFNIVCRVRHKMGRIFFSTRRIYFVISFQKPRHPTANRNARKMNKLIEGTRMEKASREISALNKSLYSKSKIIPKKNSIIWYQTVQNKSRIFYRLTSWINVEQKMFGLKIDPKISVFPTNETRYFVHPRFTQKTASKGSSDLLNPHQTLLEHKHAGSTFPGLIRACMSCKQNQTTGYGT